MKKLLLICVCIAVIISAGYFFLNAAKEKIRNDFTRPIPYPTLTVAPTFSPQSGSSVETQSIFVPYWSLHEKNASSAMYDSYIYFGIEATPAGIDMTEQGAASLATFSTLVPQGKKKFLAVRMIDSSSNFAILKDENAEKKVIADAMRIAAENHFDGIVLDLEVSAIPFESLIKQINDFTRLFYQKSHANGLMFSMTLYGDVFYRVRPFDVKTLSQNADTVMVMAYDFSKAKGNPGPNFPLRGADTYGYDYQKMTEDFLRVVPPSKLTVIFGLFGYDWLVDGQGHPLSQAKAVTASEIDKKFLTNCKYRNCSVSRDSDAAEGVIYYTDDSGSKHMVWFEDMDSVAAKKAYLKKRGITSFSYWAYSYF